MSTNSRDYWEAYYRQHKEVIKQRARQWALKYRERRRKYQKAYYKKHQKKLRRDSIEWRKANPEVKRNTRILKSYGITLDQYNAMFRKQNRKCKLCGRKVRLVLDHCHDTGRLRGFICQRCNLGIAALGDNAQGLLKALRYLQP